jgi:hypothetical protein
MSSSTRAQGPFAPARPLFDATFPSNEAAFEGRPPGAPRTGHPSTSLLQAAPRPAVTPEDVWAARLARDAARATRSEATRMRFVVYAIWTLAVALAGTLGVLVTRS